MLGLGLLGWLASWAGCGGRARAACAGCRTHTSLDPLLLACSQTIFTMRAGVYSRWNGVVVAASEAVMFALPFAGDGGGATAPLVGQGAVGTETGCLVSAGGGGC